VKSSQAPSRKTTGMSSAIQKRTSEGIIKTKAEKIAVKVVFSEKSSSFSGSGIIIKKIVQTVKLDNQQRYKYYVLTNKHVSKDLPQNNLSSKIITHEKKEYIGKSFEILKSLLKYDLQLITFESNQEYEVASISNSVEISQWDRVYIFGYPCDEKTCNVRKFIPGNIGITTLLPNSLKLNRGYSIPYTNETEPGMSGSPVLNYNAEVIAIHGLGKNAETDSSQQKDSPYLLSNESQLSSEKKEIANFFSWGIDMTRIKEELLNSLQ
jgi:S1-C subfamily serine protease